MKRSLTSVVVMSFLALGCGSSGGAGSALPDTQPPSPDAAADADTGTMNDAPVTPPCTENQACDDGNKCTQNDRCQGGECAGESYACDDGMACTRDLCDGKGGCYTELIAGNWCLIGGDCVEDGESNPSNPCEACVSPINANAWTPSDGSACDDGLDCTANDMCLGGLCRGTQDACDDNNPCTTNGCKEGQGCIHAAISGGCEDYDLCTLNDYCNNKVCVPGNNVLDCSDGDPCTQDNCSTNGGCSHVPHSGPCEDGNPCTANDLCIQGDCTPGTQQLGCDDANPCTDDVCLTYVGCAHIPNLTPCEDGDPCTSNDTCSNGECLTGLFTMDCEDGNPCTLNPCEPFNGCAAYPQVGACEDGNPCTSEDTCVNGFCKGSGVTSCDDGDPCTADVCDAKQANGCVHEFNTAPCEDGDICTEGDQCSNGVCVSNPAGCDDGNDCTIDSCDATQGCVHATSLAAECQLRFIITSPQRAVTLTGNSLVTVKGKVVSPVAPVETVTLNGVPLTLNALGKFSTEVQAVHGMNLLEGLVVDTQGGSQKAAQSFYFSSQFQPMNANNPFASSVSKALYVFLGQAMIDDGVHDLNNVDDLGTIVEILLGSFDVAALIPNPAVESGEYKVTINNLTYQKPKVSINAQTGGMHLYAVINQLHAKVDADGKCFLCPNLSGDMSVSQVIIQADLFISVQNGNVVVDLTDTNVTMVDADLDISGILGSLFDFLVDWIVGGFVSDLEKEFEDTLGDQIPETLGGALESLAFNADFKFGPFFEGGPQGTIAFQTGFEDTYWTDDGGVLRLWGAGVSPKSNNKPVLGSLLRDACMSGGVESLQLPMESALQIAVSDDLFNQILFAAWRTGVFTMPLPPDLAPQSSLNEFGISDLVVDVDLLLPPIITSCNPNDHIFLQIGDINVHATLNLFDQPVELDIYASAEAYVDMVATEEGFGIEIGDFTKLSTQVVIENESLSGASDLIEQLLGDNVVPNLFAGLTESAIGGFPIPAFDLSGLADGIPPGTELAIDVENVSRNQGWTVATGGVK